MHGFLAVLVLNSGSSSIKFSVYEAGDGQRLKLHEGAVDGIGTDQGKFWIKDAEGKKLVDQTPSLPSRAVAFKLVADALHSGDFPAPVAIGHRMVCGGPTVQHNQIITPALIDEMELYTAFAPLHTPIAVYIMRESLRLFPMCPTSSALTLTSIAPCPSSYSYAHSRGVFGDGRAPLRSAWNSYESIVFQLQPRVPHKLIVAHLGNGASISAIRDGKCVDTSMGLTPRAASSAARGQGY